MQVAPVITSAAGPVAISSTGVETIMLTSGAVVVGRDQQQVLILASFSFVGTSTPTSYQFQIRRGATVSGTVVGNSGVINDLTGVTPLWSQTLMALDTPSAAGTFQYTLTALQQSGANGTGMSNIVLAVLSMF